MTDAVIVAPPARTPVGAFNGALAPLSAAELGTIAIREAIARAGVDAADVSEVIMGQVLTAAAGQNPARQASLHAGVPQEVPAWVVNHVLRFGPEDRGAGRPGHQVGRGKDRGRRRPGEHVERAARGPRCARARRWATCRWSTP